MKHYLYVLIILFVPVFSLGQNYTNKEKMEFSTRIDSLLMNYLQKSTLTEPGGGKRNDKVIRDLKSLFITDATIFDDINPVFIENSKDYPYKLGEKSRLDYFDGLINEFNKGLIINNKQINISYANFDKGEVSVVLGRNISGTTFTDKYILFTEDTLLIKIKVQPDRSVKIEKIASIGNPRIVVINDKDLDGVIDEKDECIDVKGKMLLNGCPDDDNDGVPNKVDECQTDSGSVDNRGCPVTAFAYTYVLSGSFGWQMNKNALSSLEAGEGDLNGYASLDAEHSKGIKLDNPGYRGGPIFSANLAFYFGKRKNLKNKGISIGFSATNYSADYKMSNGVFHFKSQDAGGDDYRSIITMKEANEKLDFSIVNVPLLLRFRSKLTSKIGFEVFAGPSYIIFVTKSHYTGKYDFEGIYQNVPGTEDFTYDESGYKYNTRDVFVIRDSINSYAGMDKTNPDGPNANVLIAEYMYNNYQNDFGFDKTYEDREADGVKSRSFFALNGGIDLSYKIAPTIALKAGVTLTITQIKGRNSEYKLIDKVNGAYNSIYNSSAKSTYNAIGGNIGIIIGI